MPIFPEAAPKVSNTNLQLLENESIGVTRDSPLILDSHSALSFENPGFALSMTAGKIRIFHTGERTNFVDMTRQRNDKDRNLRDSPKHIFSRLTEKEGIELSNIGISLAITTLIDNEPYAVLVHRKHDNRFMLLSGYVDAGKMSPDSSTRALFGGNVVAEGREELLPVDRLKLVQQGTMLGPFAEQVAKELVFASGERIETLKGMGGLRMGEAYDLTYKEHAGFILETMEMLPSYIPNVHITEDFGIDGKLVTAGIQYAQQWNSAQLIVPMRLHLNNLEGLHLMHAEDRLDINDKQTLYTMLNREGLVLVRLDEMGDLTPDFSHLKDGFLVPLNLNPAEIKLSEAFARAPEGLEADGVIGFVNQANVPFEERDRAY